MTKKMKRSEFVEEAKARVQAGVSDAGDYLADLAEQAGAEWLPEQPDLPERIKVFFNAGSYLAWSTKYGGDDAPGVYTEAAADYNFVRRVERRAGDFPSGHVVSFDDLRTWLDEEREKLRTP